MCFNAPWILSAACPHDPVVQSDWDLGCGGWLGTGFVSGCGSPAPCWQACQNASLTLPSLSLPAKECKFGAGSAWAQSQLRRLDVRRGAASSSHLCFPFLLFVRGGAHSASQRRGPDPSFDVSTCCCVEVPHLRIPFRPDPGVQRLDASRCCGCCGCAWCGCYGCGWLLLLQLRFDGQG